MQQKLVDAVTKNEDKPQNCQDRKIIHNYQNLPKL